MGQEWVLESNQHVYGGEDIRIIVYNMERWLKKKKKEIEMIREKNPWE